MLSRAARLLLALTCAASLSACSKDEPDAPEPQPDPPSGPYEGPWTPLEERGEWEDPGALAECSAVGAINACGTPSDFDLSRCDGASLAGVERQGAIYRAEIRYALPNGGGGLDYVPGTGGFRFDASGQPVSVMGHAASGSLVNGERLTVSGSLTRGNTQDRFTFAGCRATGPNSFVGCMATCRNGNLRYRATFRAERMMWRPGEPESSGLQRVSEFHVGRGVPVDVYVTRGHAYVVSVNGPGRSGGLTVIDVSDPRAPVQRASLELPNDTYWNGVWAKDHGLYIASDTAGVLVYDLTDPANPSLVRREKAGVAGVVNVHTVFVEGDRLYAMSPSLRSTLIYDVSNPLDPRLVTRYGYPSNMGYPHDAFAYGGRLYVNHTTDGFLVVDPGTETPTLLGKYTYKHSYSHATAVGTFNGRTIAFEGGETLGAHLRVLDVTNPTGIAKVGEYKLRSINSIHNMVLVGTRLYVAYYHEGVRVLDVSDPTRPTEVAHYNTFRESDPGRGDGMFEGAIGIRVPGDGHVYVVDTARGLLIFDEP